MAEICKWKVFERGRYKTWTPPFGPPFGPPYGPPYGPLMDPLWTPLWTPNLDPPRQILNPQPQNKPYPNLWPLSPTF